MKRMISIPRDALAELLQAAGSPLTPEQYVASLPETELYARYPGRAKASVLSRNILAIAAVISGVWVCLPFGFSLEGLIIFAALAIFTYFEFRVHNYFCNWNPKAPELGFRNQSGFAVFILIYGLYHAFAPVEVPVEYNNVLDPDAMALIQKLTRVGYLIVGIVGGVSQFGLAWYYRLAQIKA